MSEEERQKIVVAGKRSEESGVAQVTREVLRPGASFPSAWEHLEQSLTGIISEACRMAGEEPRVELEGSDTSSFSFLRWAGVTTRLTNELGVDTLELGRAKEARAELLAELDSTRVERDEMRDDVEGVALAKQDLEWSLLEAMVKPAGLRLQKLDAKTSI
ncbi:hypothetical protein ACLOJK_037483 [Asimina triloba]